MATSAILTGPEFDALPYEQARHWELLAGELISASSPTPEHQLILQRILLALVLYLDRKPGSGMAFTDLEFALTENHRVRPDVLFLVAGRASRLDMSRVPVPGCPDLAVEIISPSERSSDTQEKLQAYLANGTEEVWQVYPKSKCVVVHRAGASVILSAGDHIGTSLLPDFALALDTLFAGPDGR